MIAPRRRLAVVSPFLDRRHGTEIATLEQIERLVAEHGWDVDIYSQRVEDLRLPSEDAPGKIRWIRVPRLPGPHLVSYAWWFVANHAVRSWARVRGSRPDLVYSPGVNCLDADVIDVHIVFREFVARTSASRSTARAKITTWPRLAHRWAYYKLIQGLERRVYGRGAVRLAAVSMKVSDDLERHYGRPAHAVAWNGVDPAIFSVARREAHRAEARQRWGLRDEDFAILLVGNDWLKKGLDTLMEAVAKVGDPRIRILVRGTDDRRLLDTSEHVIVVPPVADPIWLYAAADLYASPSREDAFGMPVAEAMACGLPAITTCQAGVSEGIEGDARELVLASPEDVEGLAARIASLANDPKQYARLATSAAANADRFSWAENARRIADELDRALNAPKPS